MEYTEGYKANCDKCANYGKSYICIRCAIYR